MASSEFGARPAGAPSKTAASSASSATTASSTSAAAKEYRVTLCAPCLCVARPEPALPDNHPALELLQATVTQLTDEARVVQYLQRGFRHLVEYILAELPESPSPKQCQTLADMHERLQASQDRVRTLRQALDEDTPPPHHGLRSVHARLQAAAAALESIFPLLPPALAMYLEHDLPRAASVSSQGSTH